MTLVGAVVVAACSSSSGERGMTATGPGAGTSAPGTHAPGQDSGVSDASADALVVEDGGGGPNDLTDTDGSADASADGADAADANASFSLTSPVFQGGGTIPDAYTCDAADVSPPLAWSNPPPGTQSYAVIMRDLTLGGSANYHWVIYDIPAATTSLAEGIALGAAPPTPAGAKQTKWSFGDLTGYGGPCPVQGPATHTYQLTLHALSVPTLPPPADPTSALAMDAVIQSNALASTSLAATYTKKP